MNRYPHLPRALHTLLAAAPSHDPHGWRRYSWSGTPTELWEALSPHRVDPWPANPVSLSLWLKHHAQAHGIQVEARHTGERRVLRLVREANGLKQVTGKAGMAFGHPLGEGIAQHSAEFCAFSSWGGVLEALPGVLEVGESYYTLAFDQGVCRISQTVPASWLPGVVERWAAQYPQAREVRIYRGEVEVSTVWPG